MLLGPLGIAALGGVAFFTLLQRMRAGSYDPHGIPSPLVGRRIPDFTLPAQPPATAGFGSADLLGAGRSVLVNFFASWCVPCLIEHPQLMQLAASGVPIWGIAYKDTAEAAADVLARKGNPYARLARDEPGRAAIDWGVYGVPETFIVGRDARIAYKLVGPITPDNLNTVLKPEIEKALAAGS